MALSLGFGACLLLMGIGVPIAFALMASTMVFLLIDPQVPMLVVTQKMLVAVDSFPLMAVPFFVLVGQAMNTGGITDRIFRFSDALVGHIRGGLGLVNVLASVIFSGMSGSAVADAAGLGQVEIKAMSDAGYHKPFSAAVTATSATIGPIIPPSIPMVIYGSMVGVSVSQLFLGGILPGILMGLGLMIGVYVVACLRHYPVQAKVGLAKLWRHFLSALPALLTPVLLVGGMVSGTFTPTEASAVAALYALFLAIVVYRDLSLSDLPRVFLDTALVCGTIFLIISAASVASWLFTWIGASQMLTDFLLKTFSSQWTLLIAINLVVLVVGCFLESNAALILMTPLLYPAVVAAGIDPIHFGIMFILNLMIGLITPPVGMNMYIVCAIAQISTAEFLKAVWPFFLVLVAVLVAVTFVPAVSLYIPSLFFG